MNKSDHWQRSFYQWGNIYEWRHWF